MNPDDNAPVNQPTDPAPTNSVQPSPEVSASTEAAISYQTPAAPTPDTTPTQISSEPEPSAPSDTDTSPVQIPNEPEPSASISNEPEPSVTSNPDQINSNQSPIDSTSEPVSTGPLENSAPIQQPASPPSLSTPASPPVTTIPQIPPADPVPSTPQIPVQPDATLPTSPTSPASAPQTPAPETSTFDEAAFVKSYLDRIRPASLASRMAHRERRLAQVMSFLAEHGSFERHDIVRILHVSASTAEDYCHELMHRGLIRRLGDNNATRYERVG
ncbi:MAG: hypothetical protein KGJ35_00555 [Patescibacteria group bacterium]|nr:hypothetical protein [Patescibacteria group bacterium]